MICVKPFFLDGAQTVPELFFSFTLTLFFSFFDKHEVKYLKLYLSVNHHSSMPVSSVRSFTGALKFLPFQFS